MDGEHLPMVVEGFEKEATVARDILEGLPEGSPFRLHPQGYEALTLLVVMRPGIGRGREMNWNEAAEALEQEFGLVADAPYLRRLCDTRVDAGLAMKTEWFRKGVMQAAGNLNKLQTINEVAESMREDYDNYRAALNISDLEPKDVKALAQTGLAVIKAHDKANELNAAVDAGVRVDKAPMFQQNIINSGPMAEFAGVETPRRPPKQADVVDAERAD